MADLRIAKVMKVHPEANAVDIVYVDTLARVPLVQVMGHVTSNTGIVDLPEPTAPKAPGDITPTDDRDVYAIVGCVGPIPVVMGFLAPQVSHLMFKGRSNFRVNRHASDVYSTLEDDGSFSMAWPNGTYLKVSETLALEDLAGADYDGKWAVKRNKTKAPKVRLMVKNGAGVQKALIDIDASTGNVAMTFAGNLTQVVTGNLSQTVQGNASLAIAGNFTSSAAGWTHTGDVTITGNLNVSQTVTATTDVVGGGKHLKTHVHGGVTAGAASTAAPT